MIYDRVLNTLPRLRWRCQNVAVRTVVACECECECDSLGDLGGIDPFAKFALGERRSQLFSSRISRIFISIQFIMETDRWFAMCLPPA